MTVKQHSPTLEGFKAIFRWPSLGLAEIAWRWSLGFAGIGLLLLGFVEYLDTLATLLRKAPYDRVLFGSHMPFLYTGAVMMKLTRARISKRAAAAIAHGNAERLFGF